MALKKCKECGNEISTDAKVCPHCGKKQPPKMRTQIGCLILFLIFFIPFLIIIYPSKKAPKKSVPTVVEKKGGIIEVRVCPRDGINIRTGPGTNYVKDQSGQLAKSERLYVLEEKNGWIRFRVTSKDVGWSGWVKKNLTVSREEWELRPQLLLLDWSWHTEYDYAIIEGTVKNVSDINLKNVEAIVKFKTKDGKFITSDSTLIEYNPILPGQVSPFKVMVRYNPAMYTAIIDFKEMFGGSIRWSKKK